MLEDLVFPAEIVGKRIRVKLDGARLFKVHLDKSNITNIEHKVRMSSQTRDCHFSSISYNRILQKSLLSSEFLFGVKIFTNN